MVRCSRGRVRLKIKLENGLSYISVTLSYQGQDLIFEKMLLDTGSMGTVFAIEKVDSIDLLPEPNDRIREICGIGGREYVLLTPSCKPAPAAILNVEGSVRISMISASVARVVGWVEARPDGGFEHGPSRAETHHLGAGIVNDGFRRG